MIKSRIYYMLLGLGLGIIISSSLNIVFNKTETAQYTDEQIKEKAKDLGMISIKENIENNDKEKVKDDMEKKEEQEEKNIEQGSEAQDSEETYSEIKAQPVEIKTENKVESHSEAPRQTESQVQYKSIVINELDTANNIINELVSSGVVEDRQELRRIVTKNKLQTKFISGTYNLKQKSSIEEVLRKLIKEKELNNVDF